MSVLAAFITIRQYTLYLRSFWRFRALEGVSSQLQTAGPAVLPVYGPSPTLTDRVAQCAFGSPQLPAAHFDTDYGLSERSLLRCTP